MRYVWPHDRDDELEITDRVSDKAVKFVERLLDFEEDIYILAKTTGRERLAFLQARSEQEWNDLTMTFPDAAMKELREFSALAEKYV